MKISLLFSSTRNAPCLVCNYGQLLSHSSLSFVIKLHWFLQFPFYIHKEVVLVKNHLVLGTVYLFMLFRTVPVLVIADEPVFLRGIDATVPVSWSPLWELPFSSSSQSSSQPSAPSMEPWLFKGAMFIVGGRALFWCTGGYEWSSASCKKPLRNYYDFSYFRKITIISCAQSDWLRAVGFQINLEKAKYRYLKFIK